MLRVGGAAAIAENQHLRSAPEGGEHRIGRSNDRVTDFDGHPVVQTSRIAQHGFNRRQLVHRPSRSGLPRRVGAGGFVSREVRAELLLGHLQRRPSAGPQPNLHGEVLPQRMPSHSSGISSRRRSPWSSKTMPNMSHVSRSSQPAAGHTLCTVGSRATRPVNRDLDAEPRVIDDR